MGRVGSLGRGHLRPGGDCQPPGQLSSATYLGSGALSWVAAQLPEE